MSFLGEIEWFGQGVTCFFDPYLVTKGGKSALDLENLGKSSNGA